MTPKGYRRFFLLQDRRVFLLVAVSASSFAGGRNRAGRGERSFFEERFDWFGVNGFFGTPGMDGVCNHQWDGIHRRTSHGPPALGMSPFCFVCFVIDLLFSFLCCMLGFVLLFIYLLHYFFGALFFWCFTSPEVLGCFQLLFWCRVFFRTHHAHEEAPEAI